VARPLSSPYACSGVVSPENRHRATASGRRLDRPASATVAATSQRSPQACQARPAATHAGESPARAGVCFRFRAHQRALAQSRRECEGKCHRATTASARIAVAFRRETRRTSSRTCGIYRSAILDDAGRSARDLAESPRERKRAEVAK